MIVVTGGAGFIGSCFVWKLNQLGFDDILIVDHLGHDEKWKNLLGKRFADYLDKDEFIERLEAGAFDAAIKGIVHLGACSTTTESDADYLVANNYHYSQTIARWCLAHQVKLWYASSAATYGDGRLGYDDDDAITVHLCPLNMYGYSKHLFDLWILRNQLQHRFTGFKFFNVFGPNEYHKGDMRSVIHKAFPLARAEARIRLFKSYRPDFPHGGQKRDFVYIKDAVEVMAFFFTRPGISGIFNLGTGNARSWNDLALALFAALGINGQIEYIDMPEALRGKYQYFTQADLTKLRRVGCTHEFMSLEASVADYVRNYLLPEAYL
ncbi:MAG: ADP-glyceromanno-heptose 6-epimerase [bacterium]|nr:ADP-glyceromanno-heptose 6-epimerase [bacterium]